MLMHLEDRLVRVEINAYEYSAEAFGLAPAGRVNSVKPVKLHFKPQLLLRALNMCHLL